MKTELATFGAGCFWGVQLLFDETPGVISTRVGYTGGKMKNPSYEDVCTDETGHAEAVEVTFDPSKVKYEKLLDIFWNNHNPTTMNRQGPDEGSQYRSAIFYHSDEQKNIAEKSREAAQKKWAPKKVVTEIVKATMFYAAEEYHQKYLEKRGQKSCHI